jgi:hypothetical protein
MEDMSMDDRLNVYGEGDYTALERSMLRHPSMRNAGPPLSETSLSELMMGLHCGDFSFKTTGESVSKPSPAPKSHDEGPCEITGETSCDFESCPPEDCDKEDDCCHSGCPLHSKNGQTDVN